jgi:hypothetical protein
VNCVQAGPDITGEISSGFVVLQGPLMAARFKYKPCFRQDRHFPLHDKYCLVKGGCEREFRPDYKFDENDQSRVQSGDKILCVKVATF